MPPVPRALLDASALVAWLRDEKGSETVERLLRISAISTVNLAESLERASVTDWHMADTIDDLRALGLAILPFEPEDAALVPSLRKAGRKLHGAPKNGTALSLGDCCCLAVAQRRKLAVITDDSAWTTLDIGVAIHLFR
jgi:ribonuclease VapC